MSRIIDITDKLNFEEKPIIKIKDIEVEANNDAISFLKVISIIEPENGESNAKMSDLLTLFELMFDKENQEKINNLKLDMKDFSTFIMKTVHVVIGDEDNDEGEEQTPATT